MTSFLFEGDQFEANAVWTFLRSVHEKHSFQFVSGPLSYRVFCSDASEFEQAVMRLEIKAFRLGLEADKTPTTINEMYHFAGRRLVKTSNCQPVPLDEPVFILRARDGVAAPVIALYRDVCREGGTPQDRLSALAEVIKRFDEYRKEHPEKIKIPGSTHGA